MAHGGKREGSGKKKLDPSQKKIRMLINLDPAIAKWVRDNAQSRYSQFINNNLKYMHDLTEKELSQQKSPSKIIAFVNQAGGVAKTTMTMNLGYQLAQLGHRILLVDLDPQAALTDFMGLEPYDLKQTVGDSLLDDSIDLAIHKDLHGMDLAPCNLSLSTTEFKLVAAIGREMRLKNVLKKHLFDYDFILIDCPPNLGILSAIGLTAATHVVVPTQTNWKSYRGVSDLLETIDTIRTQVNPDLKIAGFVPTIYSANTSHDLAILEATKENLGKVAPIFETVPRATAFAGASMAHLPLALFSRSHPALKSLKSIAKSLESVLSE